MNRSILVVLSFVTLLFTQKLNAQSVGIGAQFGEPTGLTLRINNAGNGANLDLLGAWNFNQYFFLNVHGLWERRVFDIPQFHYFYGPGLFVGAYNRKRDVEDDVYFGISGNFGLNLYLGPVEFFAQITPRFSVFPGTYGDFGGGIGGRFYFTK